jgi:hypothetical protein
MNTSLSALQIFRMWMQKNEDQHDEVEKSKTDPISLQNRCGGAHMCSQVGSTPMHSRHNSRPVRAKNRTSSDSFSDSHRPSEGPAAVLYTDRDSFLGLAAVSDPHEATAILVGPGLRFTPEQFANQLRGDAC